jgi:hypothetical protein
LCGERSKTTTSETEKKELWRPLKRDRREIKGKLNVTEREMEIVGKREECTQNDVE